MYKFVRQITAIRKYLSSKKKKRSKLGTKLTYLRPNLLLDECLRKHKKLKKEFAYSGLQLSKNKVVLFTLRYFRWFHLCGSVLHVRDCQPKGDGISSTHHLLDNIFLRQRSVKFTKISSIFTVATAEFQFSAIIYEEHHIVRMWVCMCKVCYEKKKIAKNFSGLLTHIFTSLLAINKNTTETSKLWHLWNIKFVSLFFFCPFSSWRCLWSFFVIVYLYIYELYIMRCGLVSRYIRC